MLIDDERYNEVKAAIFSAVDADNQNTMNKQDLKDFVCLLLQGITGDNKETIGDLQERHKITFSLLDDVDGDVTDYELGKLLRDLFKEVIKDLQARLET